MNESKLKKIRFGLIGPGRVGERLAKALAGCQHAELWSVCSRDPHRAQSFSKTFQAKSARPAYSSLQELLKDPELDAVIISTPDQLHFEQIELAARFSKHVFVEKPLATSIEDGLKAVQLFELAKLKLGVGYHLRFKPVLRALAREVHAGAIGEIKSIKIHWAYKYEGAANWRSSRELARWWSLSSLGTHCLDLIRWYLVPACGETTSVLGTTKRDLYRGANDESAEAHFKFASGAVAEFKCSVLHHQPLCIELVGSAGRAIGKSIVATGADSAQPLFLNDQPLNSGDGNAYVGELEDFALSILENRDPEVPGREGLRNIETLLQIDPA